MSQVASKKDFQFDFFWISGLLGARALILKHRHEQENGRTSAVTVEIMGYKVDQEDNVHAIRSF